MSVSTLPTCPNCGSKLETSPRKGVARCQGCGASWSPSGEGVQPLVARPRLTANRARLAVARELAATGRSWLPGAAQMVFYPFAPTGLTRRPFSPLAHMPPILLQRWKPGGADFLTWTGATASGVLADGAVRVPVSLSLPAHAQVVHHPFFRVALLQDGRESCAWCDAASGQVVLPPELTGAKSRRGAGRVAGALILAALAAASVGLLPWPASLAPAAFAFAIALWRLRA